LTRLTRVIVTDDIDGSDGAEMTGFALDETQYEIDLSPANLQRLRKIFGPYIAAGRVISSRAARTRPRAARGRPTSAEMIQAATSIRFPDPRTHTERTRIREWAAAQGRATKPRGRIPRDIVIDYRKKHGITE
jgi:hypothetical protein